MEIVALTNNGAFVSASKDEIVEILRSVTGKEVKELVVGQKIPAIDYASSITKVKTLGKDYRFTELQNRVNYFNESFNDLVKSVNSAASLEV